MEAQFAPARRAALHCEALVARSDEQADGLAGLARLGRALAPLLAARLGAVLGGSAWEGTTPGPLLMPTEALAERIGPVAGNFVLPVGDAGGRLFASFALAPVASRMAAMFGGEGEAVQLSPGRRLPSSLLLLVRRLEAALTASLAQCLAPAAIREGEEARFAAQLAQLPVFPPRTQAAVLPLVLGNPSGPPVEVLIACRKSTLARLLVHLTVGDQPVQAAGEPSTIGFAVSAVALPVRARLAEMKLPVRRLLALAPGQVLPLAVSRSVPLLAGGHRLATGSIGEADDRVAVQIERVLFQGDQA